MVVVFGKVGEVSYVCVCVCCVCVREREQACMQSKGYFNNGLVTQSFCSFCIGTIFC